MRNLKKILALVLALVMSMSLMATANAFTDDASIEADYETATKVLAGMKVFQGYPDGSFGPKAAITRQEVAAIMYRISSADVTDKQAALYVEGADFTDVKATDWSAGYIGYCANGGIVVGNGDGTFGPQDNVTGYQVLAMALRAIGYDKNGEFTGADWAKNVATTAQSLGILKNVPGTVQLSKPATRELVAELVFQTIATVSQVEYTPAFGYQPVKVWAGALSTLGYEQFKLTSAASNDVWGRPTTVYTYNVGAKSTTITAKPIATYTTATTECQIASDVALKTSKEYTMYTNGAVNASKYTVQAIDTVQKIGAQGTLVEVYKDVIVVIDTFLAKVKAVAPATYDAAGHKKTDARIDLEVYASATADTDAGTEIYMTNATADYTYAKGDYVLVNSYTNNTVNTTTGVVTVSSIANTNGKADYAVITGLATAKTGTQSYVLYNSLYHIIDGTTYSDAKWFMLDQAKYDDDNAHTWYFDSYGNLIGATDIATVYTYGIIENIQWQNPTMANGYAQAIIRYMDGTTETKIVAKVNGTALAYCDNGETPAFPYVSTTWQMNAGLCGKDLYRIETNTNGTINLVHVFTDTDKNGVKNGSETDNHMADAEINKFGTGAAAVSAITNGTTTVYANSNTKFLVQTIKNGVASYTVVEGYLNMAKYSVNKATVDFVNLDDDSYVDLVYVIGTPDSAADYYGLFYLNTNAGIEAYFNSTNTANSYYVVNGILDGVAGTYKVAATSTYYKTTTDTITVADFAEMVGKLSYVKVSDGKIVGIWNSVADEDDLYVSTHGETTNNATYKSQKISIQAATTTAGTTTKKGDVLKVGTEFYNIANLTPVVGAWADDMSGKNVYVIYDTTKVIAGSFVAKAVYIVDVADDSINSGDGTTPDTNAYIVRTLKIVNKDTGAVIATYTNTATYAGEITYTTTGMAGVLGVSKTNLVPFGADSVTVTGVAGKTVEATLYAYYAN